MTDIGKRLREHFSPKFNKSGEIFGALVANENGTGAIEQMFKYGDTVMETYAKSGNVYELDSALLDQAMKVLSYFERFYNESDESFVKRNKSIFIRNYDETFGTVWNLKHVFEYYFPGARIFSIDNIGLWTNNLLVNSSFESNEPEEINMWELGNAVISSLGAFAGEKGVVFQNNGVIKQSVQVENGYYFVTVAIKGKGDIEVIGENGNAKKLFKIGEKIVDGVGSKRRVSTNDWDFVQLFFHCDETETISVNVYGDMDTKLDLVTLDKKENYPRFVVYVWFDGVSIGDKTLHLSTEGEDPIEGIDYDKESYYNNAFFVGSSGKSFAEDIYNDILNMVKAAGTKGELMLLTMES